MNNGEWTLDTVRKWPIRRDTKNAVNYLKKKITNPLSFVPMFISIKMNIHMAYGIGGEMKLNSTANLFLFSTLLIQVTCMEA